MQDAAHAQANLTLHRATRGLKGPHHIFECRRTNIIGTLVQDASPFLFPCTIEVTNLPDYTVFLFKKNNIWLLLVFPYLCCNFVCDVAKYCET